MSNVLQEFLYLLGWRVDTASQSKAEGSIKAYEKAVIEAEKRAEAARLAGAKSAQEANKIKADADVRAAKDALKRAKEREAAEAAAAKAAKERTTAFVKGVAAMAVALEAAALASTAAVVKISDGLEKLYYASERTNSKVGNLKAFSYAASQLGSTAEGAAGSLEALAQNMRSSPGYEGMLKNLGVATRQNGKLRDLTEITMELGDAFAKMPHFQAKAYADALGIDERTLIALKDGSFRKAVQEYRAMLAEAGSDPEKAAKDSADFMQSWRRMLAALDIVITRIGGELSKKFGGTVDSLAKFLLKNADDIARAVVRIGETILRLATSLVDLVKRFNELDPSTRQFIIQIGAIGAALLLLNSGPVAALLALAGAIVVLYDDYKRWREGAKDTLIDWDKWAPAIQNTLAALKSLWEGFDRAAKALTGQDGLTVAFAAFALVLTAKVLAPLGKVVGLLGSLGSMRPPTWLLGLLGVGVAAKVANDAGILDAGAGSRSWHESVVRTLDPGIADRIYGKTQQGAERGPNIVSRGLGWVKEKVGLGGTSRPGGKDQTEREQRAIQHLIKKGWTPEAAASAIGQAVEESGVRSDGPLGDTARFGTGDDAAHGMFQWRGSRFRALKKFAEERGKPWTDFDTQLDFFDQERKERSKDEREWHTETDLGRGNRTGKKFEQYGGGLQHKREEHARRLLEEHRRRQRGAAPGTAGLDGVPLKGAEATGGGDVHPGTAAAARAMTRNGLPGEVKRFTALNDTWHRNHKPNSKHTAGLAGDVTLKDGTFSAQAAEAIRKAFRDAGLSDKDFNVIDEYKNPSPGSTGGHIHFQFNSEEAAAKYAEYQRSLERATEGARKTAMDGAKSVPEVAAAVEKLKQSAVDTAGKVEETLAAYPRAWMERAESSMGKTDSRFDGVDSWKKRPSFETAPLGIGGSQSSKTVNDNRTFNDQRTTNATVTGVSDPKEAAGHITGAATRQRSDLIGNFNNRYA